jgi:hypothetical protein
MRNVRFLRIQLLENLLNLNTLRLNMKRNEIKIAIENDHETNHEMNEMHEMHEINEINEVNEMHEMHQMHEIIIKTISIKIKIRMMI